MTYFIGWDIGGAHLKASVVSRKKVIAVYQAPCPLWQGLTVLAEATRLILSYLPKNRVYRHGLTMTGELVDLFDSRKQGVEKIIGIMRQLLGENHLFLFVGKSHLISVNKFALDDYEQIASANWLASVMYVAKKVPQGLFVDIGSTTTDILSFNQGHVNTVGLNDYERLCSNELIYTGIVRTPVMAITPRVQDGENTVGLMAEQFATMADVYRLTEELHEYHDQMPTADGAEKTQFASAKRLSRMLGCDFYPEELGRWQKIANHLRHLQLERIKQGCLQQLERLKQTDKNVMIGAGVGRFLVKDIATDLNMDYLDFTELVFCDDHFNSEFQPADCAPAISVALLFEH